MKNDNRHIRVCGIGPGNPDFINKIVWHQVEQADVLIGGKRQLDIFREFDKREVIFDGKTANLKKCIEKLHEGNIVVLVSGDTGFHSLRRFLKEAFPYAIIELYPGISSFQYFYAKLGLGYEQAFLASMHGVRIDFIEKLKESTSVFLLTDRKNNYRKIAKTLVENGFGQYKMHVGNYLSYPNEKIISLEANEISRLTHDFTLCSVIIENPNLK